MRFPHLYLITLFSDSSLVVGFEGDRFTSQILSELRAAKEKGIIRVVDLLVLKKDGQGNVIALELNDLSKEEAAELGPLAGDLLGLFTQEDIERAAANIPNQSAAGLLLFEHTWAIGLRDAIKNAGGVPVAGGLVALRWCKSWKKNSRWRSNMPDRNKRSSELLSSAMKKEKTNHDAKKNEKKSYCGNRCGRRGGLCGWSS